MSKNPNLPQAKSAIHEYLSVVDQQWRTGHATEHSYRGALAKLISDLCPALQIVNEPKHIECGAPDYIILKADIPLAFIEAKDIGDGDLDGRKAKGGNKEQFDRYKSSLAHIAFTDYIDFHFYEEGESVGTVRIGEIGDKHIVPLSENFDEFIAKVCALTSGTPQPITSAARLASLMAAKARILERAAAKILSEPSKGNQGIHQLMTAFKQALIPDTDSKAFADIYAQTLTYGLFAARLRDNTPETFTRYEAMALIPKSNPFLSEMFAYIGTRLEDELTWIIDDLVAMFAAADVKTILKDYGKAEAKSDPLIHFYEDFLAAYDAGLRRKRGVWNTPLPIVKFIVGAVDSILQKSFGLKDGLACRDTVEIEVDRDTTHGKKATEVVKKTVHKVQVLDPATGTGTFLAESVNRIHERFGNNQGKWQGYVEEHLLPRLNGFEILMASYTMAHVKLDFTLSNTGFVNSGNRRFNVFLTNSLEEYDNTCGLLFSFAIGEEARAARFVKRDCPVMVVMGNPPYSGESQNNGKFIMKLMEDYKKEPGGAAKLKERNPKWINDDYVKFIRLAQHYIERNGQGVVAFINPHGFLDNPTFRGMRWNLLKTFDEIHILNLHGNYKKKETAPDGSKDENVFDIMQGVSVNIFVKHPKASHAPETEKPLARVFYADLWGKRKDKFAFLLSHSLDDAGYQEITPAAPMYFFVPKNTDGEVEYNSGFSLAELMEVNSMGVTTGNDSSLVCQTQSELLQCIQSRYAENPNANLIRDYSYRPFDRQFIYYDTSKMARAREKFFAKIPNGAMSLCALKISSCKNSVCSILVAEGIVDKTILSSKDNANVFPLYLYTENMGNVEKHPNFDHAVYAKICAAAGAEGENTIPPEDIFDYIYAVLHTPEYREKYREFLKVDFPRIPYPKDAATFAHLVKCGGELRRAHLMKDSPTMGEPTAAFPIPGSGAVEEVRYDNGRVYVNSEQYFDKVPLSAFDFYIGGYQPAQKWLKDRKGRVLSADDCDHYQQIILSLVKTRKVMTELSSFSNEWLA